MIEILQTEDAMIETLQGLKNPEQVQQIHYVSYEKKKKSRKFNDSSSTSSKQNSSSTKLCYRCREPYNKKHESQCKAKNARCEECQMIGHFKRCCKKLGNFPNNHSNQQNHSSSTGSGKMNYAATVPEADFFNERGLPKAYRPPPMQQLIGSMNILKSTFRNDVILISEQGEEIQPIEQLKQPNNTPSVSGSVPTSDFPFIEFPSTEVVSQSQTDISSISDTLDPRENNNSLRKASKSTDLPLKSVQNRATDEEMTDFRDLTISEKHTSATRDSCTISISDNLTTRKSISGTKGNEISFSKEGEIQQSSNNSSVMPTDVQALTVLQDLLSDDFQTKNTHSLQRKGEDRKDEAFQLIQKIHNQLQQVQWDLQRLQSMHKYKF